MCVRRIGCAMVALIISAGAGCAADLPLIARKAPVLRASYDWTGFYAGAHVGAGFSYRNWTLVEGSTTEAGDAVMLGGQLGYNMQFGRWVTGIEADGSWGNLKDESLCPDGPNTCWTKQKWLSTATARLGYAFDPALFYFKGGVAFTKTDFFKTAQIPSALDERGDGSRSGWVFGAGMDYALANNWILRLEYDYLDFGARSVAMSNIQTGAFAETVNVRNNAHEVTLGINYLFNANNWMPVIPPATKSSEAEPKRTGLPAPLASPPFPSGDWPLGGSQLIGVPDTALGPLMRALYDGPNGQAWKDSHIKIYGWGELGANASSAHLSLAPAGYPIRPNRLELDQLVFRVERLPDTVQRDHVDWGFNVTNVYGLDYRYTIMKGIFSDQLLSKNRTYGYDIPTFYGELFFPQIGEGLNVRVGRFLSVPDIETQMAPGNYLYTHSLLYIFDPFTQMGVMSTVKLSDQWLVQFGAHAGNDVAFWEKQDAKFTPVACVRWTSRDNNDSIYPCVNSINNGKYAYDNIQMFVTTWSHKFSSNWNMQTEAYYTYQRDVPSVFGPLPIEPNTTGAFCPFGQISCFAPAWAIVNYQNFKVTKSDYFILRNEYFSDDRGQRTGTQTRYTTHSVGWGHWFNAWGENTGLLRPELRYEHSYNAPAYDRGTRRDQLIVASDVTLFY
jgi:opacity protein-like surface antigen